VCGHPRDAALDFLRGEEPFERGWYAGPVGFFDEEGNGVFAPALRSAVGHGRTWRLFAGAGIVAGSRPEGEWEETRIKFEPVLRALEASGASVRAPEGEPEALR
jgi:isochorismate synthase EntC